MDKNILIIGTGPMASDYAKVLCAQDISFQVVGRGEESALRFESETGVKPFVGGLQKYLEDVTLAVNTYVIIATGTEALMPTLLLVLSAGVAKVLIEKPAAISIGELMENEIKLAAFSHKVYVAYNRRFYASVLETRKLIEEDGGLQSMHFEFTEWSHRIEPLKKAPGVKENWFFANSTHVVDLAFSLAGIPVDWNSFSKKGEIYWHPKSNFAGAGITENGVLFSYLSNWESAGRWAIELLTRNRRIYLKPMEVIGVQQRGTVEIIAHEFDNVLDLQFKPGIFRQLNAFLKDHNTNLLNIKDHLSLTRDVYSKMIS